MTWIVKKDDKTEYVEAQGFGITPTGALIFNEGQQIVRAFNVQSWDTVDASKIQGMRSQ